MKHALRTGVLVQGDQLPTARVVVEQLAINPNTVLKAYRELEREGLVEARPGQGTFVRRALPGPTVGPESPLHRTLASWVRDARRAGLETHDMVALLTETARITAENDQQEPGGTTNPPTHHTETVATAHHPKDHE